MKKYFIKYIIEDITLFMATAFVIFLPFWVYFMVKTRFSWFITLFVCLSIFYFVREYIKFNSDQWKKKKDIIEQFEYTKDEERVFR